MKKSKFIRFLRNEFFLVLIVSLVLILSFATSAKEVNIASVYPPDSPIDKGLQKFRQLVAERSGGLIEVFIHPSSAMGDERQTYEMLSQGSVEFGALGANDIETYFPKYAMGLIPYFFKTKEDCLWKFWNGTPGKELSALIEKERGILTLGVIYRGARYLTSSRPIYSVEDVKGLKLRIPPINSWVKIWESIGALPHSIAFGEVYMSLMTGVVEAQENPLETILGYKFYETQKYLMTTEHVYSIGRILASHRWWATLSKDDQDLFTKAMEEAVAFANDITIEGELSFLEQLKELGMTVITIDSEEFRKALQPTVDQLLKETIDPLFLEKVNAALK